MEQKDKGDQFVLNTSKEITCTQCGCHNAHDSQFCISCGEQLDSLRASATQNLAPSDVYISDFSYTPLENKSAVSVEVTNSGSTIVRDLEGKLYIQSEGGQTVETVNFKICRLLPKSSEITAINTERITGRIRVRIVVFDNSRRYDFQYFNLRLVKSYS